MRRVEFPNTRGLQLVGYLHESATRKAVILAHGFAGDKSMGGRFDRIAGELTDDGFGVLAFDFSGCGESDDDRINVAKQVDDLRTGVAFVRSEGFQEIGLFGQSLGGFICLKSYEPGIRTIVTAGAGTGPMQYDWGELYSSAQMKDLRVRGYLRDRDIDQRWREAVLVDRQMLLDFEQVDQEQLLSRIPCPVLLIHGDDPSDKEEQALLALSRAGMRYLSPESRLEVIAGADHRFADHLAELIHLAKNWFRSQL